MLDLLNPILEVVLTGLASLAGLGVLLALKYLRRRFQLEITAEEEAQLEKLARDGVYLASQLFAGEAGARQKKRDRAVQYVTQEASRLGVKIAADIAGQKIEAAVNKIKRERLPDLSFGQG